MSRDFAARHVAGRRVRLVMKDGREVVGKALALVNTGKAIAIVMHMGRGRGTRRAYLNDIDRAYAEAGWEIK